MKEYSNLSSGSMMQSNGSYSGFNVHGQGSIRYGSNPHRLGSILQPTIHENFPRRKTVSLADYDRRLDRTKSTSDDDEEPSFTEDGNELRSDDPAKGSSGKKSSSPWQRVKWTDGMVRLLITAVSYISEEAAASEHGGGGSRRKFPSLQKKGKWKSVSKAMAERGHFVSPQQCEDKFNDLNKRYKRLNEILGRGTSCEVVENPAILDAMDHLSDRSKEEVRKILSSKHLHYEEMCSYHNGNRLHLPPDPELQRSLRSALRSSDDQEIESDESEENLGMPANRKRLKQCDAHEGLGFKKPDGNAEMTAGENCNNEAMGEKWIHSKRVELERQRLQIQAEMLELEGEKFKWQRSCEEKDRELDAMRMEIETMRLENERMALELREKEFGLNVGPG